MSWERALWTNKYLLISLHTLISLKSQGKKKDLTIEYSFSGFFKAEF